MQFYTGNFLDGTTIGKGGKAYRQRGGFCLETQHYPGLAEPARLPVGGAAPRTHYRQTTVYRLSVQK